MGLRTPQQYIDSLKDGRTVFYRGQRVPDVTTHPVIKKAVHHACVDYEMAEDPAVRDLAVVSENGDEYSRYYKIPAGTDDLLKRAKLIEEATARGKTLVILVKEIGTDALFALHRISRQVDQKYETEYFKRVQDFHRHCRDNDLTVSVAQTDTKGDRSQGPTGQAHPDYYTRIVERRDDGIVVRGAKVHTSCTTNVNEVIVLPTRAMSEADYAVAFALPVDTPGLKLIASPTAAARRPSSTIRSAPTARWWTRSPSSTTSSCPGSGCSSRASTTSAGRSPSGLSSITASRRSATSFRSSTRLLAAACSWRT
jgi:aromatic ring hydroxylase